MKLKLNMCNPEWCENGADTVVVEINSEFLDKVAELSAIVREHDLNNVSKFNYSPELFSIDYEGEEEKLVPYTGRVECEQLVITSKDVYWEGYYKHTDFRWSTDSAGIEALRELLHIESCPLEELPPLVGTQLKSGWAEELLQKRLGGTDGK